MVKTRLVRRILEERLIQPFPSRIIWVYGEWQDDYKAIQDQLYVEFVHGYSDTLLDSLDATERNLLILDDQMGEASDSKSLAKLFTKGSHHRNLTIMYLVQNMFDQGKSSRTVSLNCHYLIIFRNLRDESQFGSIARQMMPKNSGWLCEAFADATERAHGYLLVDCHPRCDSAFRVRSNILPGEETVFYSSRNQ